MRPEERKTRWQKWLKTIENEVTAMLIHVAIYDHLGEVVKANPKIQRGNSLYEWLQRVHIVDLGCRIRRQIDNDEDSVSLRRLMEDVAEEPGLVTRTEFRSLYAESGIADAADGDFDSLVGAGQESPTVANIERDRDQLVTQCGKIKKLVDRRFAHFDRRQAPPDLVFKDFFDAVGLIERMLDRYHHLLTGSYVAMKVPPGILDFDDLLMRPWIPGVDEV